MEKRDALKYLVTGLIFAGLAALLFFFRGGDFIGYAIFEDFSEGDFNNGTYINTTYNGSAVVLVGDNLSGSYTSKVFDAGSDAVWNNITKTQIISDIEFLFGVDNSADIWKTSDLGVSWSLVRDDYNNGDTNGATDMAKNSFGSLFILFNQDVWVSDNEGVTWTKVNDDYNDAEGQNGFVLGIDKNNNLIIVEGDQDVWKSTDNGVSFAKVSNDFNGGNGNIFGIVVNNSNLVFVVDNQADVWASSNSGVVWALVKDDYNGANGNSATDMAIDSSDNIFILDSQDVWESTNSGATWSLVNDDLNEGSDTNNGIVIYADRNNYVYVIDGSEDVFKSTNSGTNFSKLVSNFNGGNGNIFGLSSIISSTNLSFQVRNCSQSNCSDGNWQDADLDNLNLVGQYFQYKVLFTSPDSSATSILENVIIDYTILNTAPDLGIYLPDGLYGTNESLPLNYSVSDENNNLDSCWYNIKDLPDGLIIKENTIIGTGGNCQNVTFNVPGNGNYNLTLYANDTEGAESSDSKEFYVQIGAPIISLSAPIDNEYLGYKDNIQFNYIPGDANLDSCQLWGNFIGIFELNQTNYSPDNYSINTFTLNLNDGEYLWNIWCNNSLGKSGFNGNKTFYVDTISPDLILNEPAGAKTSRTVSAEWSVGDASPVNCLYNVYQGASPDIINASVDCSLESTSFDVSADGSFTFNFYVNDSAGNSNSTSSSFSVDSSSSPSSNEGGSAGGGGSGGSGAVIINATNIGKLDVSEIGNIIVREGEQKTLSLNVKNTGKIFLNSCKLMVNGDVDSWINSGQVEGLSPGENVDFAFNLNVPEGIGSGDYFGELEIKCDEGNNFQKIVVSIPGLSSIKIKDIKQEGKLLTVVYEFDNSKIVGESAFVDIWLEDSEGYEITRFQDVFSMNKDGLIERTVEFELENDAGIYYLYLALSDDLENFVKESVVLGKGEGTGFVIFDTTQGKIGVYIAFLLIVCVAIFFIWRRHGKAEHPEHHWFFGDKKKKVLNK